MRKPCSVHAATTTSRCRNRRSTISASNRPHTSTVIAGHEPGTASTFIVADRPGPSNPASHRTTASSTTVTATAGPRNSPVKITSDNPTTSTNPINQPIPVVCKGCGNGGGRPDGRRRRDERPTSATPSRPGDAAADTG